VAEEDEGGRQRKTLISLLPNFGRFAIITLSKNMSM